MLQKTLAVIGLSTLVFSASILTSYAQAKSNTEELSMSEVENVSKIIKITDLNQRKEAIKNELKQNNSQKYKDFISTKVASDEVLELKNSSSLPSKYEAKIKTYGCWDGTGSKIGTALAGNWLYRYNLRVSYCADTSKVYSGFIRSTWADIYTIGWGYYGDTGDRRFDYLTTTEYVASRQGIFKLCVNNNWSCVQESRPWIEYHATREGRNDYFY